jgi:hypothetical protein
MNRDPQSYYERLDVEWDATPDVIHAAYRRKARVLHPDIPKTGDAAAFLAIKEAYEVLSDPLRRAAYDRAARSLDRLRAAVVPDEGEEILPDPPTPPPIIPTRGPRLSDVPLPLWVGLGVVALVVGGEVLLHLDAPAASDPTVDIPATAPTVPPQAPPPPPRPIRLIGTPNVYVTPAEGAPAVVMRYDKPHDSYVPIGQLPPFSTIQAVRSVPDHGLVEFRLTETATGFIDMSRLNPGSAADARDAFCTYNAGAPPSNGEVLARAPGSGDGQMTIQNHTSQPMVVRLRDHNGVAAATIYLDSGGEASIGGLPAGTYRPDFATGELWSRACNSFSTGMRAQRFTAFVPVSALGTLAVPPDGPNGAAPEDIPNQDFEHD